MCLEKDNDSIGAEKDQCYALVFRTFISGTISGVIETLVTNPLDVIKTRLQFQPRRQINGDEHYRSISDCFIKMLRNEGASSFYKGILAEILSDPPRRAMRLSLYEQYNLYLFSAREMTTVKFALVGGVTGLTESLILVPFEHVKVKMQTNYSTQPPNIVQVVTNIIKEDGLGTRGLYKGLDCTLARNGLFGAVYFGIYHTIKSYTQLYPSEQVQSILHFTGGFISACLAALFNTPFDVAKSKVQGLQLGQSKFNYLVPTLVYIFRHEGFVGLYQGFAPRLLLLGVENGVVMVVYEYVLGSFKSDCDRTFF